jgi:Arc/MetJ-type ribon-helix-helix transcriptional regulator
MARTLITLDDQAKAWLAKQARAERVSMSEIVRRAVDQLRAEYERTQALTEDLQQTTGIWKDGDGLDWQNHLRDEWKGR